MPSIFSRIIAGELPGRFVWRDERVGRVPVDRADAARPHARRAARRGRPLDRPRARRSPRTCSRSRSRSAGRSTSSGTRRRVGVLIVGEEVPHVHIHVVPINNAGRAVVRRTSTVHRRPRRSTTRPSAIRARLRELGHADADAELALLVASAPGGRQQSAEAERSRRPRARRTCRRAPGRTRGERG